MPRKILALGIAMLLAVTGGIIVWLVQFEYRASSFNAAERVEVPYYDQFSRMLLDVVDAVSNERRAETCEQMATRNAGFVTIPGDKIAVIDLCQQARVAVSTAQVSLLTLVQAVLAAIGVFLLGFTLHFTKGTMKAAQDTLVLAQQTLREAEGATSAAQASAKASEDMIKQGRAWLVIKTTGGTIHQTSIVEDKPYSLVVKIKNCGSSPATSVRTHSGHLIREFAPQEIKLDPQHSYAGVIGSGEESSFMVHLAQHEVEQLRPGPHQEGAYVRVRVVYKTTMFQDEKVTDETLAIRIVTDDPDAEVFGRVEKITIALSKIEGMSTFS